MATPALRALRNHFADARFIGVVKPYVAGILEGGDWFDEIVPYESAGWTRGIVTLARQLRRRRIDLALLFPNSFHSALAAYLGGCRRRIGYARYGRSWLLTDAVDPVRDRNKKLTPSPVIDAYNLLAETPGCPQPSRRMELFTTPDDERAADQIWLKAGFEDFNEVVCLNPGAAFGSSKHWPVPHFVKLAKQIIEQRGSRVLILCGPSEAALAQEIAAEVGLAGVHALSDLTDPACADQPPLSLGLSKALVRRCDLLVTTDSGPRHFAAAFDRPVITLFGPTHIAWTETFYPRAIHLQKSVPCGPCQKRICPLDHRCMTSLTPEEVFGAVRRVLPLRRSA